MQNFSLPEVIMPVKYDFRSPDLMESSLTSLIHIRTDQLGALRLLIPSVARRETLLRYVLLLHNKGNLYLCVCSLADRLLHLESPGGSHVVLEIELLLYPSCSQKSMFRPIKFLILTDLIQILNIKFKNTCS